MPTDESTLAYLKSIDDRLRSIEANTKDLPELWQRVKDLERESERKDKEAADAVKTAGDKRHDWKQTMVTSVACIIAAVIGSLMTVGVTWLVMRHP